MKTAGKLLQSLKENNCRLIVNTSCISALRFATTPVLLWCHFLHSQKSKLQFWCLGKENKAPSSSTFSRSLPKLKTYQARQFPFRSNASFFDTIPTPYDIVTRMLWMLPFSGTTSATRTFCNMFLITKTCSKSSFVASD